MRGRNLKPSRVYQTASLLLESEAISQPPPWFDTIGTIPPGEILTRTQPVQHRVSNHKSRVRKPSKLFRPQPIEFEEDRLRKEFYRDHPWELARPRIILENDGKDGQMCDWSKIQQRGRQLNGESVIQRQLWLMHNQGKSQSEAYDAARKELYDLRQEEEIERRVAREEAQWTGAQFGKGAVDIGSDLEDKAYEDWKAWATKEVELRLAAQGASFAGEEDVDIEAGETEEPSLS